MLLLYTETLDAIESPVKIKETKKNITPKVIKIKKEVKISNNNNSESEGNAAVKIENKESLDDGDEIEIKDRKHYEKLIEITNNDEDIIPLLVKDKQGVLEIISSNNRISRSGIAEIIHINESAIQKHLKTLKEKGFLERIDGTRGYWEIHL